MHCAPIVYYGLEYVFMSKSLADSLNFCRSRKMYKIFYISESACAETIMFCMGHMSHQLDLCRLRFYHCTTTFSVAMKLYGMLPMPSSAV